MTFSNPNAQCKIWQNQKKNFLKIFSNDWYFFLANIYSDIVKNTHEFYSNLNIYPSLLPITVGSISSPMGLGSDSLPVKINLMGKETYLADSMQFHLEYFLRFGFPGVYYIMPTFRGEDPDERHLNQFFHSEVEVLGDLNTVMDLVERYIIFLTKKILAARFKELNLLVGDVLHLEKIIGLKQFPRITYKEAIEMLGDNPSYYSKYSDNTLVISSQGEQELIKKFDGIVWLTKHPALTVPFYQAYDGGDATTALCADLLLGIGEVVGCGQRHESYKDLEYSLEFHQVAKDEYEWYIEMKKQFPLKTAGFGMGIERYLLWLLKHNDIRDMHIFNRLKTSSYIP